VVTQCLEDKEKEYDKEKEELKTEFTTMSNRTINQ
jgi:hypothetical protein